MLRDPKDIMYKGTAMARRMALLRGLLPLPDTLTREEESRLINDGFLITKKNGITISWGV